MAKRIFALFLCLALSSVLCLQVITGVAAADPVANGTCGTGLTWTLDSDGVLIVSGSGAMTDYSSSNAVPWGTEIKTVVVQNGVTSIGDSAFRDCKNLTSITLPKGVKRIGINAFYGCTGLTEVSLPETVEGIGVSAFSDCTALTSVVLPPAVTTIAAYTFSNCSALTSVTLPTGLTTIELFAFERCTALEEITLPQSLTAIGDVAFSGCSALKEITIPENVERVSTQAFTECSSLTAIHVAADNRFYSDDENGVLYNKEKTELIRCPEAFAGAYVIPDSVITLQSSAFRDCVGLTGITIPEGVVNFEGACFRNCTALKSVTIPGSVKKTGSWTFAGCTGLAEVTLCEGISEIGGAMFQDCTALSQISIPESVKTIGDQAFFGCTELSAIRVDANNTAYYSDALGVLYNKEKTLLIYVPRKAKLGNYLVPEGVTTIGNALYGGGFDGCTELTSITIPASVTKIDYWVFSGCTELSAIWVDADNAAYSSDARGILYNKEKTGLVRVPEKAALGDYSVPAGVTEIAAQAFHGCGGLSSVTIPEGVKTIYYMAFSFCTNLKEVILPSTATDIHDYVFMGCTALESINLQEGMTNICGYTFADCSSLKSIDIPSSVTGIGIGAFRGCTNLESVVMPEGVSYIYAMAFGNCVNLKTVCFRGDAPKTFSYLVFQIYDANKENIGSEDGVNIPGLTLYYIEGKDGWTTPEWNGYPTMTWDGLNVPKGHEHDYKASVTAPTCTEKGYTTYVCACGSSYVADEVAALGHAWDGGKVTVAPTSEKEGVKTITCTRCGATQEEVIAKLPSATSFTDVDAGAYYANAVNWAVANNVTNGTSTSTFSPEATCTRGQIVTFLWRAAGEPNPAGAANPFTDVKENAYYYKAVLWAVENGITSGTSKTTFSPDEGCTRGQVATFLWRYEGMPSHTVGNPFTDVKVGAYYYGAVLWAVENGITNGTSATTFDPEATCTRGQIVTFLYRDIAN